MTPLDSEISKARALVVDSNAGPRGALVGMLKEFGVVNVAQARTAKDARSMLELMRYDIVLCEYHFEGEPVTGQDIMDDLRLAHLLPLSTVVVMISSESSYNRVAEAAEAALDAYLLKPHTADALRQRIKQARDRKRALADIIRLVDKEAYLEAAEMCEQRFQARGAAWLHAARIGAELWLRLGKPHASQLLFEAILQVGAVPWARLGVARTQYEAGGTVLARRTLESLLNELPSYADAYDVMGRVLLDQGQPEMALDALRQATSLTPGSVARLVKHGLLAFYYGDPHEAAEILAKAARLGANSRIFDLQGLVLLAFVQFDQGDRRGLAQSLNAMGSARAANQASPRLRRFECIISVLHHLRERRVADAVTQAREMIAEVELPNFEFEAACNLLSALARLSQSELELDSVREQMVLLARRFAVSRTTTELLVSASFRFAVFEQIVKQAHAEIGATAEEAVSKTVGGEPAEAVRLLLTTAETTHNAKLIDMALHTIERHRERIPDADALLERVKSLHQRYRGYGTQVQISRSDDPRLMTGVARS